MNVVTSGWGRRVLREGEAAGFTLLEVLLSAAILSVLFTSLFAALNTAHRASKAGRSRFDLARRSIILSTRLRSWISQASPYRQRNRKADFQGDDRRLSFVVLHRDPASDKAPYLVIIAWEEGRFVVRKDGYAFLRSEFDEEKFEKETLPWVKALDLAYWDGNEWLDEWRLDAKGRLPWAVRVRATITAPDPAEPLEMEEIIQIEGSLRPNFR